MPQPRFVVVGSGAIGGVVGARLHQAGHDVLLVARGAHGQAIAEGGLRIDDPDASVTLRIPVVADASVVDYRDGDVTLLSVKTQDTVGALDAVRRGGGATHPVVCLQNGVVNEAMALRIAPVVYGVAVMCPGQHLEPGVVQAYSAPVSGLLDIGRYPATPVAADDVAHTVADAFRSATFLSDVVDDVERSKYTKLLLNLGNAVEVVCGPANRGELFGRAHAEGAAVLTSARIPFDTGDDPRRVRMSMRPVGGERREGGSTWQSAQRGLQLESDYLAGEIVLTARRHGVAAPVNELLQSLAAEVAAGARAPGSIPEDEVLARLG